MRFTAFQNSQFVGTAGGNALRASSRHGLRTAGRARLETLAVPDHRPIFKLESDLRESLGWKNICEAREACSCIPHESSRSECYAVFGLDGKRMDRYFASVYRMEQILKKPAPSEMVEVVEPVPEGRWEKLADRTRDAVIQSVINGLLQMLRGLGVTVPAADGRAAPPSLSPRAEPESRTEAA